MQTDTTTSKSYSQFAKDIVYWQLKAHWHAKQYLKNIHTWIWTLRSVVYKSVRIYLQEYLVVKVMEIG